LTLDKCRFSRVVEVKADQSRLVRKQKERNLKQYRQLLREILLSREAKE
jgi:hypothetical protein